MRKGLGAKAMLAALADGVARLHATAETTARVQIENFAFDPPALTLRAGDRVVFVNRDEAPHSVVGRRGEEEVFRSQEQMDTDETFSIVVDRPGEIAIVCGLHANMVARIVVKP